MKIKIQFKENIANILTVFRMFAVLIIATFLVIYQVENLYFNKRFLSIFYLTLIVLVIFIFGITTDWMDGYIARKLNIVSQFGKTFDPIADKLLVYCAMLYLCSINALFFIYIILFLFRDLFITNIRKKMLKNKKNIKANIFGKLKTCIHFFSIIFVLVSILFLVPTNSYYFDNITWVIIYNIIFFISLVFSFFSLIYY